MRTLSILCLSLLSSMISAADDGDDWRYSCFRNPNLLQHSDENIKIRGEYEYDESVAYVEVMNKKMHACDEGADVCYDSGSHPGIRAFALFISEDQRSLKKAKEYFKKELLTSHKRLTQMHAALYEGNDILVRCIESEIRHFGINHNELGKNTIEMFFAVALAHYGLGRYYRKGEAKQALLVWQPKMVATSAENEAYGCMQPMQLVRNGVLPYNRLYMNIGLLQLSQNECNQLVQKDIIEARNALFELVKQSGAHSRLLLYRTSAHIMLSCQTFMGKASRNSPIINWVDANARKLFEDVDHQQVRRDVIARWGNG